MSARFPHRKAAGALTQAHAPTTPEAASGPAPLLRDDSTPVPSSACCCPARPLVKVIIPAGRAHPEPVDLWLCGHHWRVSAEALAGVGATIYDVSTPALPVAEFRENATV
jgi:hypothetical protein